MDRYPDFIQYFVVFLVALYTLANGHLLCAPCLSLPTVQHAEHDCSHFYHQTSEVLTSAPCCSDDHNERIPCNSKDLPTIIVQRSADELAKLLKIHIVDSISIVYAKCQSELVRFRSISTFHPPASSLRLHLLYAVLAI